MKVVVQRCLEASVVVDEKMVGRINKGYLLLVGFTHDDNYDKIDFMVDKIVNLRVFDDDLGVMNRSILDVDGSVLSVSQFTLYADPMAGRRPSYKASMNKKEAEVMYALFNQKLREKGIKVETGIFGADMKVALINDGPVTILLEK